MKDDIRILSVEKKGKQYLVTTTEKDYRMDEDTIIKHMIFKDKVFSKQDFALILGDVEAGKTLYKALSYLRFGMRSEHDMREHLKEMTFVDGVIKKLFDLNYIDDEKLAMQLLEHYMRMGKGPRFIENKLYEKKIPAIFIRKTLSSFSEDTERETIKALLEKHIATMHHFPINKQRTLLSSKLIRQGYQPNLVFEIMQTLEFVDESDDTLRKDYQKIKKQYEKRSLPSNEVKQKIITKLMQQGYAYDKVRRIVGEEEWID